MIDFNSNGIFSRLKKVSPDAFGSIINDFLIEGEEVIGAYKSIRDGLVFTNKRIVAINVQGVTGKKQDYTNIPYSKISTFSIETAGVFDLDSELELYISGVGKIKFQFTQSTGVKEICKAISRFTLGEEPLRPAYAQPMPYQPAPSRAPVRPQCSQSKLEEDAPILDISSLNF